MKYMMEAGEILMGRHDQINEIRWKIFLTGKYEGEEG
jgi:hypothetical protein